MFSYHVLHSVVKKGDLCNVMCVMEGFGRGVSSNPTLSDYEPVFYMFILSAVLREGNLSELREGNLPKLREVYPPKLREGNLPELRKGNGWEVGRRRVAGRKGNLKGVEGKREENRAGGLEREENGAGGVGRDMYGKS